MDDVEAIKQLKARYFRFLDTKDWGGLATVFADDAKLDFTGAGAGEYDGGAEFIAFLRSVIEEATTVHLGHTPEVELTSPTTATGIWVLEDYAWWPEGGPLSHLHGFGHYHETYEKTDAGWQIKTSKITRIHTIVED